VSPRFRWILYAEVLVCFGLLFFDLLFGAIFFLQWVQDFIAEGDSLPEILLTLGGLAGAIGIVGTLALIRGWHPRLKALRVVQICVITGLAAVVFFSFHFGLLSSRTWEGGIAPIWVPVVFMLVLPLACAAHLVLLARGQLLR
jgi:hypothetical protein